EFCSGRRRNTANRHCHYPAVTDFDGAALDERSGRINDPRISDDGPERVRVAIALPPRGGSRSLPHTAPKWRSEGCSDAASDNRAAVRYREIATFSRNS